MHALVVVAHPRPASVTHAVAARIAEGVRDAGHSAELADLAAEGFDPRFTEHDVAVHRERRSPSADVRAEQARIDRADALALVYPVYWWSFPGLLKGWIDRVFSNGWAYDEVPGQPLAKKLQRLPVYLAAIGGADWRTYARHGYFGAMRTQIDHGIFDYCGAQVPRSELLLEPADGDWGENFGIARALGARIAREFSPTRQRPSASPEPLPTGAR
ncbi:NAD(P)H dehydrogenase (quinone) [Variovorax sp. TBS-050B]|uniref:NAD(P)H-dependent oxidoreductase n=1 Tax=Variovorax sp. TBS-050B TaxID=2940551 RepID=UPI00247574AB|nr:NAD(P)H-dependent oxidoreductase [Variovorax sp. TBS-050B]MDH6591283.1 NAD(P)H dehydrogenase (quinone) [Variovorax sp. TBS-050B]